jgi:hypothetical protein
MKGFRNTHTSVGDCAVGNGGSGVNIVRWNMIVSTAYQAKKERVPFVRQKLETFERVQELQIVFQRLSIFWSNRIESKVWHLSRFTISSTDWTVTETFEFLFPRDLKKSWVDVWNPDKAYLPNLEKVIGNMPVRRNRNKAESAEQIRTTDDKIFHFATQTISSDNPICGIACRECTIAIAKIHKIASFSAHLSRVFCSNCAS